MAERFTFDLERMLAPIPGDNPAGRDLRYDPLYDTVRERRRIVDVKIGLRAAAAGRDRAKVDQTEGLTHQLDEADRKKQAAAESSFDPGGPSAEAILSTIRRDVAGALTTRSKDLQLATWFLEAHAWADNFTGATEGLRLVRGLIERFWDPCFPAIDAEDDEPLAARLGVLDWINAKLPAIVRAMPLNREGEPWSITDYENARTWVRSLKVPAEDPDYDEQFASKRFQEVLSASGADYLGALSQSISACVDAVVALEKATDVTCVSRRPRADGSETVTLLIGFKAVIKALEECKAIVDRAHPPEPEDPAESSGDAGASDVAATDSSSGDAADTTGTPAVRSARRGPSAAISDREDALSRLQAASAFLATENLSDPTPYLVGRAVAFGPLFASADINEAQPLTSPPTALRLQLKTLATDALHDELLQTAEKFVRTSPRQAWLDVQRYVVMALEQQGHAGAATAVRLQVKALLATLPDLVDAEFADGTPVANQETRRWLREEGLIASSGPLPILREAAPPAAPSGDVPSAAPPPPSLVDEALALVRARQIPAALARLQQHVAAAGSGRDRFLRRLDLAEVCLEAGNASLAFPVLDELAGIIEREKLEDWEDRALIVRAWSALVRCCRQLDTLPEAQARGRDVFTRLCRLDISTALDLDRTAPSPASRGLRR